MKIKIKKQLLKENFLNDDQEFASSKFYKVFKEKMEESKKLKDQNKPYWTGPVGNVGWYNLLIFFNRENLLSERFKEFREKLKTSSYGDLLLPATAAKISKEVEQIPQGVRFDDDRIFRQYTIVKKPGREYEKLSFKIYLTVHIDQKDIPNMEVADAENYIRTITKISNAMLKGIKKREREYKGSVKMKFMQSLDFMLKHVDTFAIYYYYREDGQKILDLLESSAIPKFNSFLQKNSPIPAKFLNPEERRNKYYKSTLAFDPKGKEDTSNSKFMAKSIRKYIVNDNVFETFYRNLNNPTKTRNLLIEMIKLLYDFYGIDKIGINIKTS